jgi:hypothetical protein
MHKKIPETRVSDGCAASLSRVSFPQSNQPNN